jgi:methionine-rich copper-binding protein CopC
MGGTLFMLKAVIFALALCAAAVTTPCLAHAKLLSSSPADGAHLSEAPKMLTLKFNEAAQLAVLKLVSGGKEIVVPVDKTAKASQSFALPLPALAAGNYTVQWTAVAADAGHVTKGSFAFSITA